MNNLAEEQRKMREKNMNLKTLKRVTSYNDRVAITARKSAKTLLRERNKELDAIHVKSLEDTALEVLASSGYVGDFFTREHICKFCKENKTKANMSKGTLLPCRRCAKLKIKLSLYRLTLKDYWNMWNDQHGLCAICNEPLSKPHIDHCHDLLHVRGLLCSRCNTGLGFFKDSPVLFRRAVTYVEKNNLERKWWVQKDLVEKEV